MPLDEAARRLGVTRRRVQALVSSGQIPARRVGLQWLVPAEVLGQYQHTSVRNPGRPLTQHGAWAEIGQLERRHPDTAPALDRIRRRVRPRANHIDVYVHPGVLHKLLDSATLVRSGRAAAVEAGVPVDLGDYDMYVRASEIAGLIAEVRASETFTGANVHLHVVDDDQWPFEPIQRFASLWVAWLDLEDRQDRAASTLLDRLGGRARA